MQILLTMRFYAHRGWHQQKRKRLVVKVPSKGVIQQSDLLERSPYAPKFEDSSEEKTLKQERCARRVACEMAKSTRKFKYKTKATFHSLSEVW